MDKLPVARHSEQRGETSHRPVASQVPWESPLRPVSPRLLATEPPSPLSRGLSRHRSAGAQVTLVLLNHGPGVQEW